MQAVRFGNGPPRTAESGTIGVRGNGRVGWWWFSGLHDPVIRAGGCLPDIYSQRVWRRECVEVRDNKFGGRAREIDASDIGLSSDFWEGCA
jgi:hypothetical protein